MKLTVSVAALLATALIVVAADPAAPQGPPGRGFRQGMYTPEQIEKMPADVQVLVKQMQEKMKEMQALRAQIHEKLGTNDPVQLQGPGRGGPQGERAPRGEGPRGQRPPPPQKVDAEK